MTHTPIKPLAELQMRMQKHSSYKISKVSGLAPNTVRSIRNGLNPNPTITTLDKVSAALDSMEGVEHE